MFSGKAIERFFFIVFLLLPIAYCILYAPIGFSDTDQGFFPGLCWRILQGQVPYVDFVYVRPPIPIYFHALEMHLLPEGYQMIGSRYFMYLEIWISVLFAAVTLGKIAAKHIPEGHHWLIASLGFVIGVHNFPPMPWHTIDGVFFASAGILLMSNRPTVLPQLFGVFFLLLSALCKQPFLILLPAAIVMSLLTSGWKSAGRQITYFLIAGMIAAWLMYAIHPEFIATMLKQISGSGSLQELFRTGVYEYLKGGAIVTIAVGIMILASILKNSFIRIPALPVISLWLVITSIAFLNVIVTWQNEIFKLPALWFSHALWIFGILSAIRIWKEDRRAGIGLSMLLIVSWAASVSWGYATPLLFMAPALFGSVSFINIFTSSRRLIRIHTGVLLAFLIFAGMMYRFPYRDEPAENCIYDLGTLSPEYSRILTGRRSYEKHEDLLGLVNIHGPEFTVFPSMPHAHHFCRLKPQWKSDWEHNGEILFDSNKDELWSDLDQSGLVVLIEKDKMKELDNPGKYGAGIAKLVTENWMQIDETEFFRVYTRSK